MSTRPVIRLFNPLKNARSLRQLRRRWPGFLRRLVQLTSVAFVIYAGFGGIWRNFKHAHNSQRLVTLMVGDFWGTLYGFNDRVLSAFGDPGQVSEGMLGMPWASTIFGVPVADPLLVAGTALSAGELSMGLLLAALIPIGIAALLGRVFCSYLCPMRVLFDIGHGVRRGLSIVLQRFFGFGLPYVEVNGKWGGFVLLGGLIASATTGVAVWVVLLPYVALSASIFLGITAQVMSSLLFVVGGWLLIDLVSPGLFCKALCPTGWLLGRVGFFAPLRVIKSKEGSCPSHCHVCENVCPYALSPREESHEDSCDLCGVCVASCPKTLLGRQFTKARHHDAAKSPRRSLPILPTSALMVLLTSSMLLSPAAAQAHHNKGLPHYGYFENYPQVPTDEYAIAEKGWEMGATIFNFQGLERRRADTPNDVKIYLYIYDLLNDAAYKGPVHFKVIHEGKVITEFDREHVDEESVYSTRETLPESGSYGLVANIPLTPPRTIHLPFKVDLASDGVDWRVLALFGLPVLVLFGLAIIGRNGLKGTRPRPRSSGAALLLVGLGTLATTLFATPTLAETSTTDTPAMSCGAQMACGASMKIMKAADGAKAMVMDGMPLPWFLTAIILVLVVSFIIVEMRGNKEASTWRFNLVKNKRAYRFVRSRWFQAVPQMTLVVAFFALIYIGLFGNRLHNFMPVVVWTIWWAGLIFMVVLIGPAFCFACPWDGLSNLMTRLRVIARVEPLNFGFSFPKWARNLYPAIVLFTVLTWLELGFGVTTNPRATAYMGLGMATMAVVSALLFEKKAFCRHVCPVGRISGIYANFAPVEIRSKRPRVCQSCKTEDCLNGNERGYPCPTGISLKVINDANYCTLCTECIKSCDKQNIAINLRPFGADLAVKHSGRLDEAWLAVSLLCLTLFHGLSMTSAWENMKPGSKSLMHWLMASQGFSRTESFSLGMVVVMAMPALLYWLSCNVAARLTRNVIKARELFVQYAWSLIPVALFYHLAHNAMHLFSEGGHAVSMVSDPMGTGANYFGTANWHLGALLNDQVLWVFQVGLILVGHVFGIVVASRIAHRIYGEDKRAAVRSLIPMLILMVLLSCAGLGLMHLDMNMRIGRM